MYGMILGYTTLKDNLFETKDEAIEDGLSDLASKIWPPPVEGKLAKWRLRQANAVKHEALQPYLDELDFEFRMSYNTEVTQNMLDAEKVFMDTIISEFTPLVYEPIEVETVNLEEWAIKHNHKTVKSYKEQELMRQLTELRKDN